MRRHQGEPLRQGRKGRHLEPYHRVALRARHWSVRLVVKHGAHHEGTGPARLVHVVLHGVQNDHGAQPFAPHHQLDTVSCRRGQVGQDRQGLDLPRSHLPPLRDCPPHLGFHPVAAPGLCPAHQPHDCAWSFDRLGARGRARRCCCFRRPSLGGGRFWLDGGG